MGREHLGQGIGLLPGRGQLLVRRVVGRSRRGWLRGEGEVALRELCASLERGSGLDEVPNLSWRDRSGTVVRNPIPAKIAKSELGNFPIPDFSNLPDKLYKGLSIESSRGCAFDCSFCSTSYRKTWRGMPAAVFANIDRAYRALGFYGDPAVELVLVDLSGGPGQRRLLRRLPGELATAVDQLVTGPTTSA